VKIAKLITIVQGIARIRSKFTKNRQKVN
jgi:hypothetical protein